MTVAAVGRFPATVGRFPARRPELAGDGGRGGAIPGRRARGEDFSERREREKRRERKENKKKRKKNEKKRVLIIIYSGPIKGEPNRSLKLEPAG